MISLKKALLSKDLKGLITLFLAWKISIILIAFLAYSKFPISEDFFKYCGSFDFFRAFANWDGGHFIGIAQNGYMHIFQHAFFPLYPLLIKGVSFLTLRDYFLASNIVSSLSLMGALIFLFKLVKERFKDEDLAFRSCFYLLIFPSSVFLAASYSESTFLFLVIASFYFGFKRNFLLASLFAAFATATKFIGVFLIFTLIFEYLYQINFSLKKIRKDFLYLILIAPLGLIFYIIYLSATMGDPMLFLTSQSYWNRSTEVIYPIITFISDILKLSSGMVSEDRFLIRIFDLFFTLAFLLTTGLIFKRVSKSLGIFSFLVIIFPLLSGTLDSMTRYVLSAFPFFILLAKFGKNPLVDKALTIFSVMLLSLFTALFITGRWVG